MSSESIEDRVRRLGAEHFAVAIQDITEFQGPGDLPGWDSVGHLRLVQKLEEEFGLQFTVYDIMEFNSFGDICATLQRLLT